MQADLAVHYKSVQPLVCQGDFTVALRCSPEKVCVGVCDVRSHFCFFNSPEKTLNTWNQECCVLEFFEKKMLFVRGIVEIPHLLQIKASFRTR